MNSRQKGKRGEREWAAKLRELGFPKARRGQQYHGLEGEDVVGGIPGTHCEVKRVEQLRLYEALDQAVKDCPCFHIPYVVHRRNRGEWVVMIHASNLHAFAEAVFESRNSGKK